MIHVPVGLLRNTHQHIQLHILHPPHIHLLPAQCKTKNSNILSSAFIIHVHRERLEKNGPNADVHVLGHSHDQILSKAPNHTFQCGHTYIPAHTPLIWFSRRTYHASTRRHQWHLKTSMQLDRPTRRNQRRRSKRIRWIQRILNTPLLSPIWGKGPPASAAVHVSHRQRSNGHPNSTTTICSLGSGY